MGDKLPCQGIRVADFGRMISIPFLTSLLGKLGAEVIEVESKFALDRFRDWLPFADNVRGVNRAAAFNLYNLSKKSITLNLKKAEGGALAKKLVEKSDVVAENFVPGVMDKLGLGYAEIKKAKPDIIMLSCSGYGQYGPLAQRPSYGNVLHAYSGLTALTGYADGRPRGMGGTWADPVSGLYGALAILAALYHRHNTGEGQYIDLAMSEVVACHLPQAIMDYMVNGKVWKCVGNRDDTMAPHNVYRCLGDDKWIAIAVSTDQEWRSLCAVMGNPQWTKEERFSDRHSRWQNQDELDKLISTWTLNHIDYEIMKRLQAVGVPAGPSLDNEPLVNDPHLHERGLFVEVEHPEVGKRPAMGLPWKISDVPPPRLEHAPLLGQHNRYVFHDLLGLSEERIRQLEQEEVIC